MWLPNSSVETLTRPRLAVALISAFAAVSVGYYTYQASHPSRVFDPSLGPSLHRSNAVRHGRRSRRRGGRERAGTASTSSSEIPGDENAESQNIPPVADQRAGGEAPPPGDGETVVDAGVDDWWNDTTHVPPDQRAGQTMVALLFRVSEDNARRNGCVHRGCQCNACGMLPIRGVRYRCANCADFDLCETCEAQGVHIRTHIFYKIRVPAPPFGPRQMQPVWYTGDPDTCRRSLPRGLVSKLIKETGFERPELDAFWEQWTFMANAEWREDPDELCVAMDRKTFERCLVPTGGSRHAAPNLIHDRMFSFYDSNRDGLIGFAEFLHGLSYRRQKDKLRKVFEGYDIDGDGYVNRRDFLRMFRAYYVLYKQMHRDILDGLEDQLLASTEAQQLVNSRQPLSSLFGREGGVPAADGNMRFEGKTYHQDGTVDVAEGYENAVVEDHGDTASRQDILTSLFAVETDQQSRRQFVTRNDTDTDWRTVRRLSGTEADRTYWVTLLEPPSTLDELPDILLGNRTIDADEQEDDVEDDEDGEGSRRRGSGSDDELPPATESEARARGISHNRRKAPKLEKRRRDMARGQLHERWKRRQFYLDEEEGGMEPEDWENDEDILRQIQEMAEASRSANGHASNEQPSAASSRSNSKSRFTENTRNGETRPSPTTSSRGLRERWAGIDIPLAERDAGKEILYQVTQQAFNELLDTIFKPVEEVAIQAAETKQDRDKYKEEIDAVGQPGVAQPPKASTSEGKRASSSYKPVEEKTLEDLLSETGYTVQPQEQSEPRNAVDLENRINGFKEEKQDGDRDAASNGKASDAHDHRDPTLPQFRPNSDAIEPERPRTPEKPALETLLLWKALNNAEAMADKRGGWGRLSFAEFEEIYKSQEHRSNRLDYLGSWIDFCIP